MELTLVNGQGSVNVSETVFNTEFNEALVHQVVLAYQANSHKGTKKQKTRAEVNGSNKKPWNQKKTGNARAGDRKGPLWRSGGVTFAARPHVSSQKVNKKMYKGALRSIFSELVRQDRLVVINKFDVEAPKTKLLLAQLKALNLDNVLLVESEPSENVYLAARNLKNVGYLLSNEVNPYDLVKFDKVLVTEEAVKELEEMLL